MRVEGGGNKTKGYSISMPSQRYSLYQNETWFENIKRNCKKNPASQQSPVLNIARFMKIPSWFFIYFLKNGQKAERLERHF